MADLFKMASKFEYCIVFNTIYIEKFDFSKFQQISCCVYTKEHWPQHDLLYFCYCKICSIIKSQTAFDVILKCGWNWLQKEIIVRIMSMNRKLKVSIEHDKLMNYKNKYRIFSKNCCWEFIINFRSSQNAISYRLYIVLKYYRYNFAVKLAAHLLRK
jgi:hypothetical protein